MSDRPPSYVSTDDPPPPLDPVPRAVPDFPSTYQVGRSPDVRFVGVGDVKSHLVLLGAFRRLRDEVEAGKGGPQAEGGVPLEPKARWAVFVQVAVYRFELLVRALEKSATELGTLTLPLDVALVLHSYLLNPL